MYKLLKSGFFEGSYSYWKNVLVKTAHFFTHPPLNDLSTYLFSLQAIQMRCQLLALLLKG